MKYMTENNMKKIISITITIIIIVWSGVVVYPVSGSDSLFKFGGKILYVGGGGPGNYTNIQDAIDNASPGDIVFVFNGTYYEHLLINKKISLIGEDKENTRVDGSGTVTVLRIYSSFVNLTGFTIQNGGKGAWDHGVEVSNEASVHIFNCIVTGNSGGIRFNSVSDSSIIGCYIHNNSWSSITIFGSSANLLIDNCTIADNGAEGGYIGSIDLDGMERGCWCSSIRITGCILKNNWFAGILVGDRCKDIEVDHNYISGNEKNGISVLHVINAPNGDVNIHDNIIVENGNGQDFAAGIFLQTSHEGVTITRNTVEENNPYGIYLLRSRHAKIFENNFVNNVQNAYFSQFSLFNRWRSNYWEDNGDPSVDVPKVIKGFLLYQRIPWMNFDWSPAREPYDI